MIDRIYSWPVRALFIQAVAMLAFCLFGGTSWAWEDVPDTDHPPPLSPEESAKRFKVADGLAISLVVAEPDGQRARYDVVVANLTADDLIALMSEIGGLVAPTGEAILSGILLPREVSVIESLAAHGFGVVERRTAGEWVTFVARPDQGDAGAS